MMRTRRKFVTDPMGARALVRTATHKPFVCFGCGSAKPLDTEYVGATTYWGKRVKTCTSCWLTGVGRVDL